MSINGWLKFWGVFLYISIKKGYLKVSFSFLAEKERFDPCRKYSRLVRVRSGAHPMLLIFSLVALSLSATGGARAPSPRLLLCKRRIKFTPLRRQKKKQDRPTGLSCFLAEKERFELSHRFKPVYTLSRGASSAS